jgi:hypothetical protein
MTPIICAQLACFLIGGAALLVYLAYRAMRRRS